MTTPVEYIKCALCGDRIRNNGWHTCKRPVIDYSQCWRCHVPIECGPPQDLRRVLYGRDRDVSPDH